MAVNLRRLEDEKREEILVECFCEADPLFIEEAIKRIAKFSIVSLTSVTVLW